MGLDGVELLLAIEDRFQISLSDEEVSHVSTVGDLHRLVLSKLPGGDAKACLTSAAFYRTRRALADALGQGRREIRPSTPLAPLMGADTRGRWRAVEERLGLALPGLDTPPWTPWACLLGGAAVPAVLRVDIWSIVAAVGVSVGLVRLSRRFANRLPARLATVGDLARDVAALNVGQLTCEMQARSEREVLDIVRGVIAKQQGITLDRITPDATLAGDLGID